MCSPVGARRVFSRASPRAVGGMNKYIVRVRLLNKITSGTESRARTVRGPSAPVAVPEPAGRLRSQIRSTRTCACTALGACMKGLGYYWVSPRTKKPPQVTVHVKSLNRKIISASSICSQSRAASSNECCLWPRLLQREAVRHARQHAMAVS